jgi:hypothetical protein
MQFSLISYLNTSNRRKIFGSCAPKNKQKNEEKNKHTLLPESKTSLIANPKINVILMGTLKEITLLHLFFR